MPAINCDQFTKILDDKLIPLNSTMSELKKSVNEAMSFLEVVNAKYDELLEMMKSSKEIPIRPLFNQFSFHKKEQYD